MPKQSNSSLNVHTQTGASLIVVLLILVVVSILGVSGIQISMLGERSARNERDSQIAWQSAEAALIDAEFDIEGLPITSTARRNTIFALGQTDAAQFIQDCGNSGQVRGLCAPNGDNVKPAWLSVDFTATGNNAPTTALGTFTGRSFPSGSAGVQPAKPPRYVIENIKTPECRKCPGPGHSSCPPSCQYIYRVTAMGFGPNPETQAVLQMLYRN